MASSRLKIGELERELNTTKFGLCNRIARVARAAGVEGALEQINKPLLLNKIGASFTLIYFSNHFCYQCNAPIKFIIQ